MSKPTAFSLSKDAVDFLSAHQDSLKNSLKYMIPIVVFFDVIVLSLEEAGYEGWPSLVSGVLAVFIYGFFTLAWHRLALMGEGISNPFLLPNANKRFFVLFIGFSVLLGVAMGFAGELGGFAVGLYHKETIGFLGLGFGILLSLIVVIAASIFFLRVSFLLPAQSVGVQLGFKDAMRASKGLVWPILGANLIFGLLMIVALILYMLVVGIALKMGGGDAEPGGVAMVVVSTITAIPVHLAAFVILALCIVVLSRAYQWGIGNNPVR